MKTIKKILLPLIFLCQILLGQIALAEIQIANDKATTVSQTNTPADLKPIDIIKDPSLLIDQWQDAPIPLSSYTEEEKRLQRLINDKTATAVQTYSTEAQDSEWTKYDHDEITPYTWKVLELDLTESNGKTFPTSLLRPNWWIRNIGADRKGNRFYLKIPDVVEGWAVVKNIRINQLDTRLWDEARKGDFVYRPVTATFQHDSNNVQQLYFTGNDTPLEVTPEHPIYSIDKKDFVPAGILSIGEQVKTRQGITTLEQRKQLTGTHRVYNLEVYRDHNFMVSMDSLLVHNTKGKGSYGGGFNNKPHELPDNIKGTFAGGRYTTKVLDKDVILYRAGKKGTPLGQFFSTDKPISEIQTRIDKAVLPKWPDGGASPLDTVYTIKIPKGTTIHTGKVGNQGGFYMGGTKQIVIEKPWLIEGVEVIESSPLVK